jgi:hypothetical protein
VQSASTINLRTLVLISAEELEAGGAVPLNRFQKWLLGLKGALETWIVVLLAFLAADAYVLARGIW